jgi:hypothetical protein
MGSRKRQSQWPHSADQHDRSRNDPWRTNRTDRVKLDKPQISVSHVGFNNQDHEFPSNVRAVYRSARAFWGSNSSCIAARAGMVRR